MNLSDNRTRICLILAGREEFRFKLRIKYSLINPFSFASLISNRLQQGGMTLFGTLANLCLHTTIRQRDKSMNWLLKTCPDKALLRWKEMHRQFLQKLCSLNCIVCMPTSVNPMSQAPKDHFKKIGLLANLSHNVVEHDVLLSLTQREPEAAVKKPRCLNVFAVPSQNYLFLSLK